MSQVSPAPFDDTAFVETLRSTLCERSPHVAGILRTLKERAQCWPDLPLHMVKEELLSVAWDGWPALQPARHRACAGILSSWLRDAPREDGVAPAEAVAESTDESSMHAAPSTALDGKVRLMPRHEQQLREFCVQDEPAGALLHELAACPSMDAAISAVRRGLRWLDPARTSLFLTAIGYPSVWPRRPTLGFLQRLGVMESSGPPPVQRQLYRAFATRLAHNHGALGLPAVEFLLHAFSGAWRVEQMRPVCGAPVPRCRECAFAAQCPWARQHRAAVERVRQPVREWVESERPRERLLNGRELSDAELLAIILHSGSAELSAVDLARSILDVVGGSLWQLHCCSPGQLVRRLQEKKIRGVGPAKAAQLKAALELGVRAASTARDERSHPRAPFTRSRDVFERCRPRYVGASQEEFCILLLDTKHRLMREEVISRGTLDASIVHPRDVFRCALEHAAGAVIFVHNHPSGDPTPSREDRALTQRLAEAGQLLGIRVLDHVIIGAQTYYSFADEGEIRT
jgi:DNA repair protein RadC